MQTENDPTTNVLQIFKSLAPLPRAAELEPIVAPRQHGHLSCRGLLQGRCNLTFTPDCQSSLSLCKSEASSNTDYLSGQVLFSPDLLKTAAACRTLYKSLQLRSELHCSSVIQVSRAGERLCPPPPSPTVLGSHSVPFSLTICSAITFLQAFACLPAGCGEQR